MSLSRENKTEIMNLLSACKMNYLLKHDQCLGKCNKLEYKPKHFKQKMVSLKEGINELKKEKQSVHDLQKLNLFQISNWHLIRHDTERLVQIMRFSRIVNLFLPVLTGCSHLTVFSVLEIF